MVGVEGAKTVENVETSLRGRKKKVFGSTEFEVERALFTTHSTSSHKIQMYSKGNIMTTIMTSGPFLLKNWLSALKSECLYYANLLFRMIAHLFICKIHKHSRAQDNLVRYLSTSVFSPLKKKKQHHLLCHTYYWNNIKRQQRTGK